MGLREEIQRHIDVLRPGGQLSQFLPDYEYRKSQEEMTAAVVRAFVQEEIAIIEAGTGVGKSLAYLLPAISWALEQEEPVVVSTNTINLQEQLLEKDIPLIQAALGWSFSAVVVKGWSNYLCRLKVGDLLQQTQLLEDDETKAKQRLQQWAKTTHSGSRSDLDFYVSESLWLKFACDADDCWRNDCPYFSDCFFFEHRRAATKAQLLITNHHLLCADLAIKQVSPQAGVLPRYERVIIDEAHNLEDVACAYLGSNLSRLGTRQLLGRLYRKGKNKETGLLPSLRHTGHRLGLDELVTTVETTLQPAYRDLEEVATRLFQRLDAVVPQDIAAVGLRLRADDSPLWRKWCEQIVPELVQLAVAANELGKKLLDLAEPLEDDEACKETYHNIKGMANRCVNLGATADFFATYPHDNFVVWMEYAGSPRANLTLRSAPIDVGPFLGEHLFSSNKTVVLTSATLTVNNDFAFVTKRLGIGKEADPLLQERTFTVQLASPFFYKEQVFLGVPRDLPDPREEAYDQALLELLVELLPKTKGRTFILFTSYAALERQARLLSERLPDFVFLVQGTKERKQLVEEFCTTPKAVLLGTDSFWEGVDVPGSALCCVVLAKLPFKAVEDPITEAKCEAIRQRGGNDFIEYMLPLAVLKTRQGFGRLIRKTTDMGIVLLCDARVLRRPYGAVVLNSLPECTFHRGTIQEILHACEDFIPE